MMNTFERGVKFIFDRTIAFLLLLLFSPVFLICYIAIKQEDGGPAIFKQERIGLHGRPFYIYKFRSMRTDAERAGAMLCCGEQDKRLTKVGKFLRMHHLDELPQLWNVLIGDMSFVVRVPSGKYISTRLCRRIHVTNCCIRFVRESPRMLLCIMAIPIR